MRAGGSVALVLACVAAGCRAPEPSVHAHPSASAPPPPSATVASSGAPPTAPASASADAPPGEARAAPVGSALSPAEQARALSIVLAGDLAGDAIGKMGKGDGAGCLADLDRARERDAKTEARLAMIRAQCEMLSGRCVAGIKRMTEAYREHVGPEQAARAAESVAAMRCRGGDTSPRVKLLGALHALQQGAYVERVEPAECKRLDREVRAGAAVVKPIDDGDTQVKSIPDHLPFTTAKCLEKAGDCASAVAVASAPDSAVARAVASITDAAVRKKSLDDAVRGMLPGCFPPPK